MINSNKILGNILGNKPRRDRVSMNKIYNEDECFYHRDGCITTTRCPECKNHGKDIETRGDCKNLIKHKNGEIGQCSCYSEEHK